MRHCLAVVRQCEHVQASLFLQHGRVQSQCAPAPPPRVSTPPLHASALISQPPTQLVRPRPAALRPHAPKPPPCCTPRPAPHRPQPLPNPLLRWPFSCWPGVPPLLGFGRDIPHPSSPPLPCRRTCVSLVAAASGSRSPRARSTASWLVSTSHSPSLRGGPAGGRARLREWHGGLGVGCGLAEDARRCAKARQRQRASVGDPQPDDPFGQLARLQKEVPLPMRWSCWDPAVRGERSCLTFRDRVTHRHAAHLFIYGLASSQRSHGSSTGF
jgi:hypothetical protein